MSFVSNLILDLATTVMSGAEAIDTTMAQVSRTLDAKVNQAVEGLVIRKQLATNLCDLNFVVVPNSRESSDLSTPTESPSLPSTPPSETVKSGSFASLDATPIPPQLQVANAPKPRPTINQISHFLETFNGSTSEMLQFLNIPSPSMGPMSLIERQRLYVAQQQKEQSILPAETLPINSTSQLKNEVTDVTQKAKNVAGQFLSFVK